MPQNSECATILKRKREYLSSPRTGSCAAYAQPIGMQLLMLTRL